MKAVPSQIVKLFVLVTAIIVLLSQTLVVAKEFIVIDLEENLNEENITLGVELEKEPFVMPTADSVENEAYRNRVAGTDKWNDLILKVSEEEEVDPVFVKCIMTLESAGEQDLVCTNGNSTKDYGLMQINSTWESSFNFDEILSNPEYAIRAGIKVIKIKIDSAIRNGKEPTVHEVAWRYNGYSEKGNLYANRFVTLYEDITDTSSNETIILKTKENVNNEKVLIERT